MDKKQAWLQLVQEKSRHYLNLGDGGFDERAGIRVQRVSDLGYLFA